MLRLVLFTGAILLMTNNSFAQDLSAMQCQQVRDAVAQYGYAAARQHALANYGPAAVSAGDRCLAHNSREPYRTRYGHYRTHYPTHRRAHYH